MDAVADRVKETTTSTGTGDITTAGAASGFVTINNGVGQNIYVPYVLLDANGTSWETGKGYLSSATNFKRTRVYKSTNSNNAINLTAGTHTIFIDAHAQFFDNLNGKIYAVSKSLPMP